MRRFLMVIALCLLLTTAVSAVSRVTQLQSSTAVASDGTCRVTLTATLLLEENPDKLYFPLPQQARDVTLNGTIARTTTVDGKRCISLSSVIYGAGAHTVTLQYSLPDSVSAVKNDLVLTLELLSGFSYPVEKLNFTVTLPGPVESRPSFTSSYLLDSVASDITWREENGILSGTVTRQLPDRETLTMTLTVPENLFPQSVSKKLAVDLGGTAVLILSAVTVLYWLITMRGLPPRRIRRTQAPEGLSAGELGCCLTGQGADLTMMVLSWAQMGYLLLQLDDNGRVLLHKRMDMGNERSDFENRYFRNLFGKKKVVDGTGYHYARLCLKARSVCPNQRSYYQKGSGNPQLLRLMAVGVHVIGGLILAAAFSEHTVWQILLSILLIPLGASSAWQLQEGFRCLHSRSKLDLWLGIALSVVWIGLCVLAGHGELVFLTLVLQPFVGLAAAYGGRRSELGRQNMASILGLRRYLRSIPNSELQRILRQDPSFCYNMAPYAMALGVDKAFTRLFGGYRMPECSYLTTGMDGHLTAREWNRLLREAVSALDERSRRLPLDRLLGR